MPLEIMSWTKQKVTEKPRNIYKENYRKNSVFFNKDHRTTDWVEWTGTIDIETLDTGLNKKEVNLYGAAHIRYLCMKKTLAVIDIIDIDLATVLKILHFLHWLQFWPPGANVLNNNLLI